METTKLEPRWETQLWATVWFVSQQLAGRDVRAPKYSIKAWLIDGRLNMVSLF
jgi:hypothetical protein